MILQSKLRRSIALLLATTVLTVAPVWSQEEAGEDEGRPTHTVSIEFEGWSMQPAGLDYTPATVSDPFVSVANQAVTTKFDTERSDRIGADYRLPGNMGTVFAGYQAVDFATREEQYEPGSYIFGETLAFRVPTSHPGAPGVNDDAFADGFLYTTATSLREWVIGYERDAFRTQRVEGRWSIGWRSTRHRRNQEATYYAILSPLPPLLPPSVDCTAPDDVSGGVILNCQLAPAPDTASVGSTYDGRGPMAKLDVDIKLWRDKVILQTGAGYTVQRGKMSADFIGTNRFYQCTSDLIDPNTGEGCVAGEILTDPWSEISQIIPGEGGDPPTQVSSAVEQESLSAGTRVVSESASSDILDIYLGLRWKVLNWFEVSGGFRSSRYSDMGVDLTPQDVTTSVSGALVVPTATVKKASVTYEGFYIGFKFSFF